MKRTSITRRKSCLNCGHVFRPHPRSKGKQNYCVNLECQQARQRHNEKLWRKDNPDCLEYQYELTRAWFKAHPQYSQTRRENDPDLKSRNRDQTRVRMRRVRQKQRFDKSKSILQQLALGQIDKCYFGGRFRWLHLRLTKASRFSKWASLWKNAPRLDVGTVTLPQGKLYELRRETFDLARTDSKDP